MEFGGDHAAQGVVPSLHIQGGDGYIDCCLARYRDAVGEDVRGPGVP